MIPLVECADVAELSHLSYRALLRDLAHVERVIAEQWEHTRLELLIERNSQ